MRDQVGEAPSGDGDRPRRGWDVVIVFLALHFAICTALFRAQGSAYGRPPVRGDLHTLWSGLFFLLWGTASLVARRFETRSILFQILNGKPNSRQVIGWLFTLLSTFLLGRYAGVF